MEITKSTNRNAALIIVAMGTFLIPFISGALNVALPRIGSEFAMDAVLLSWVSTGFLLSTIMFTVPFGRVADIYGRKKIYLYGMIAMTVISLFQMVASSAVMLITLQFILGIAGAMILSANVAIISSAFPSGDRGNALGLNAAAAYFSTSMGPFLGGILTQYFGWRSIFILPVLVGLTIVILTLWKLKGDWVEAKGEKFDTTGSIIYCLMLVAVILGFTKLPDLAGVGLLAVGIIGFIMFVMWEKRVTHAVLELSLFKNNKVFIFSTVALLLNYGATFAVGFLLSLYLQYVKGFSPQDAGVVLITLPIVQAVFSIVAGKMSYRVQPQKVASMGMVVSTLSFLIFVFLDNESTIIHIVAGLVVQGFGLALFASPNTNAAMQAVEKKYYGVASATLATMRHFGMIMSMVIVMLLFEYYLGKQQITMENLGTFMQSAKIAFIIFSILCFMGIFASMARGKKQ